MTPRSPAKAGAQERASAAVAAPWTPASAGEQPDPRTEYLLRLGDDALVLGQRLSEWCGHGPILEVDISLANLALDLIGQATLLLGEAGDGDSLAFHRDVLDFRNCLLVEQPNGDFAQTIARHLLYTTWQHMLLDRLQQSSDRFLVEFAHKAVKEVAYHRELAGEWTVRLGDAQRVEMLGHSTQSLPLRVGVGARQELHHGEEVAEMLAVMAAAAAENRALVGGRLQPCFIQHLRNGRPIILLERAGIGRDAGVDRSLKAVVDLEQLRNEAPHPVESFGHPPRAFLGPVAKPDGPVSRQFAMIGDFLDALGRDRREPLVS